MYTYWSADAEGFCFSASDPSLAENARRLLMDYLTSTCEADSDFGSAELIFGELISNVVKHAPGAMTVRARSDGGKVRLDVSDEGPGYEIEASLPAPLDEMHRGLFIVAALGEELRTYRNGADQVTTCILPVRAKAEGLRIAEALGSRFVNLAHSQRIELQTNALLALLRLQHPGVVAHLEDVAVLAERIARAVDLPADAVARTRDAARLHDIGMNAVPRALLAHRGALSPPEWSAIERHAILGAEVVADSPVLAHLAPIVRAHHERIDGRGYPDGLVGDEIPFESRIIAVADAFLTMTVRQPYRDVVSPARALAELHAERGTHFDDAAVDGLGELLGSRSIARGSA